MHEYDRGLTVQITDELFAALRPSLSTLLTELRQHPQVKDAFLKQHFDKDRQWQFGMEMLKIMHFDFEAGRQDISEHPFTTSFNSRDVRLTTRIDENDFTNMTWSCLHEGGHGLYEQGLPEDQYGLPLGEYCSLSIHESQSRLWENGVGRSYAFWQKHYPLLLSYFPEQFRDIAVEDFYKAINKVNPSLIRTEADELTYHFHVMIRYELEKKLIEGSLHTKDIPAYWNEQYKAYLGLTVPDDKTGCLQDVHWSHGSFGYFATYSIGSLYAAQFMNTINGLPGFNEGFQQGSSTQIFNWLQQHIYPYGRYYTSGQLCKKATGEPLNSEHFIRYAREKFYKIYVS
jgi:carboxypeptidase Taq